MAPLEIRLSSQAAKDITHWQKTDPKIHRRVTELLTGIKADPFTGIGKPEPLRGNLSGKWSRRINREHRIVYAVQNDVIYVHMCRYHYRPDV